MLCHLKLLCTSFNNKPGKNDAQTGAFQAESRELFVLEAAGAGEEQRSWAVRRSHPSVLAGYKSCVSVKTPVPCLLLTVWGTGDQWPVDVPSKSLHRRSHLCGELHRLQDVHVSGLIVQSHLAAADTWTQLAPDTSHCHRWRIQCRSG